MSIRRVSSREVYRNAWMAVREDDIVREDGSAGIFGVVEKPDFAVVIPYDGVGFHLVEQYRYAVQGRYWEFPQGSWAGDGGGDAEALARAELREETGLVAGSFARLGHLYEAYGYANQGFHVFLATELEHAGRVVLNEERDLVVRWFSREAFEDLVRDGRIKDAPTLAAYSLLGLAEHAGLRYP